MSMDGFMSQCAALAWLEDNNNPSAFSSNRFSDTVDTIAFVRALHECGAEEVLISNILDEPWRIEEEGGPYADLMIVTLPQDKAKREQIMQIYQTECRDHFCNEGDERSGIRGDTLTFWWD